MFGIYISKTIYISYVELLVSKKYSDFHSNIFHNIYISGIKISKNIYFNLNINIKYIKLIM